MNCSIWGNLQQNQTKWAVSRSECQSQNWALALGANFLNLNQTGKNSSYFSFSYIPYSLFTSGVTGNQFLVLQLKARLYLVWLALRQKGGRDWQSDERMIRFGTPSLWNSRGVRDKVGKPGESSAYFFYATKGTEQELIAWQHNENFKTITTLTYLCSCWQLIIMLCSLFSWFGTDCNKTRQSEP